VDDIVIRPNNSPTNAVEHQHRALVPNPLTSLSLKATNNNDNGRTTKASSDQAAAATATMNTNPPLASFLETILQRFLKLCFLRECSSLIINIAASSNRALLKGNIDNLSISARNCVFRFNLLSLGRCDLSGKDLRLGYVPLVILPLLPLLLWKLRRFTRLALFGLILLQQTGQLTESSSLTSLLRRTKAQIWHTMGARPSAINFSIGIDQQDVDRSMVMKFWLRGILRSLVENSVVGAAAAFADAQSAMMEDIKRQMLPSGNANGGDGSASALAVAGFQSQNTKGGAREQGLITSNLLSATSFELKDVSFSNGRIVLCAEGIMPREQNQNGKQTHLPFTIRAKLEPTELIEGQQQRTEQQQRRQQNKSYNAIGIVNPECRMNTKPLTAGSLLGKLIPNVVWLPFGIGVAVPLGKRCQLYRVDATGGKDGSDEEGRCRIDGTIALFRKPPQQNGGSLVRQIN